MKIDAVIVAAGSSTRFGDTDKLLVPLAGRPALKVPLNLACRRDESSAATLAFIDLVRKLSA